jgi:hypothetical protein
MTPTDQRRAFRLPVPIEQEEAELRWQGVDYPVRVTDQSAGGFGIQVECPLDIDANQTAYLIWGEGASRVRVVNRVDEGTFVRLCLERIEDSGAADGGEPSSSLWSTEGARRRLPGFELSHYALGIVAVLGVALAGMAWGLMPHGEVAALHAPSASHERQEKYASAAEARGRAAKLAEQAATFWRDDPVKRALNATNLPRPAQTWIAQQAQVVQGIVQGILRSFASAPADARKATRVVQQAAGEATDRIARAVAAGSDSIISALPRFMDLLGLSARQRRELDEVVRKAHEATEQIHRRVNELGTQQAMQEIGRIRQAAGKSALALLSPAQTEKLRSLMSAGPASRPKSATTGGRGSK